MLLSGDSYLWTVFSAGLPGTESTGYFNLYAARRTAAGWGSSRLSPAASQAQGSLPGSASADQRYATFEVEGNRGGTLGFCTTSCLISYVRYPDGSFHLLGEGTVPTGSDTDGFNNGFVDDPFAAARWITAGGTHQIFQASTPLTSEAPAERVEVYDRTPSGLKLVSLLPGEVPPSETSIFAGSSLDGSTVLFESVGDLYARVDNAKTLAVASGAGGEVLPGGVTADGSKVFYAQAGNIFVYDIAAESSSPVASPGNATLVNVSPDGSHAYFISETELVPGEGTAGALNLYVWTETSLEFIATVGFEDLSHGSGGLGFWTPGFAARTAATNANRLANTARTTADGKIFAFESREQLTAYPTAGHNAIYRYDAVSGKLICASCSPVKPAAAADSEFVAAEGDPGVPKVNSMHEIPNLSSDGQQIVFDSRDSLLPRDVNGVRDVYEWRAGTLSLISTGAAARPSALYGVTPSGNDIFFDTGERLVGKGQETGRFAVYDARVGGGLASQQLEQSLDCVGEACQGQPTTPPGLSTPGSSTFHGKGNIKARCHKPRHKRHHRKAHSSKRRSHKKGCRPAKAGSGK